MTYDFQTLIVGRDGKPIKDGPGAEGADVKIGSVCIIALDAVDPSKRIDGAEKYRRAHLADRIYRAKEPIKLDVEDVALLKTLVGEQIMNPLVVKQVWDFLASPSAPTGPEGPAVV